MLDQMSATPSTRVSFQLEPLESRMLLAGAGDLSALTVTGAYLTNLETATDGHVVITGLDGGELVIDGSLIDDSVTSLKVTGFSKVTYTGSDTFATLELASVGTFSGVAVDVGDTLKSDQVDSLKLHSLSGVAVFKGVESRLEVFDSRSATIFSYLDRLTLNVGEGLGVLVSLNPNLVIKLEAPTNRSGISGYSQLIDLNHVEPDSPQTVDDPQLPYHFILVSLSNHETGDLFLTKLQNALRGGDLRTVETAFGDYLRNIDAQTATSAITLTGEDSATLDLAALGRLTRSSELLAMGGTEPAAPVTKQMAPEFVAKPISPTLGSDAIVLAHSVSADFRGIDELNPTVANPRVAIELTRASEAPAEPSYSQESFPSALEGLRSSLSTLVPEVKAHIMTVSAFIVDNVGSQLEPGTLPGLLVDARSGRGRHDSSGWLEV